VNERVYPACKSFNVAPQNAHAQTVKGRDERRTAEFKSLQKFVDAIAHLLGGLVRESNRENVARPHTTFSDDVRDAMCDDARFARACAARISNGPSLEATASRCGSLSWERKSKSYPCV